jgi:hypothetical protein
MHVTSFVVSLSQAVGAPSASQVKVAEEAHDVSESRTDLQAAGTWLACPLHWFMQEALSGPLEHFAATILLHTVSHEAPPLLPLLLLQPLMDIRAANRKDIRVCIHVSEVEVVIRSRRTEALAWESPRDAPAMCYAESLANIPRMLGAFGSQPGTSGAGRSETRSEPLCSAFSAPRRGFRRVQSAASTAIERSLSKEKTIELELGALPHPLSR